MDSLHSLMECSDSVVRDAVRQAVKNAQRNRSMALSYMGIANVDQLQELGKRHLSTLMEGQDRSTKICPVKELEKKVVALLDPETKINFYETKLRLYGRSDEQLEQLSRKHLSVILSESSSDVKSIEVNDIEVNNNKSSLFPRRSSTGKRRGSISNLSECSSDEVISSAVDETSTPSDKRRKTVF